MTVSQYFSAVYSSGSEVKASNEMREPVKWRWWSFATFLSPFSTPHNTYSGVESFIYACTKIAEYISPRGKVQQQHCREEDSLFSWVILQVALSSSLQSHTTLHTHGRAATHSWSSDKHRLTLTPRTDIHPRQWSHYTMLRSSCKLCPAFANKLTAVCM